MAQVDTMHVHGDPDEHLPTASTCFFQASLAPPASPSTRAATPMVQFARVLPSHVCRSPPLPPRQLHLPAYTSAEVLKERLLYAVYNCATQELC